MKKILLCSENPTAENLKKASEVFDYDFERKKILVILDTLHLHEFSKDNFKKAWVFSDLSLYSKPYLLKDNSPEQIKKDIEDADLIFLNGGVVSNLYRAIESKNLVEFFLEKIHAGKIFIGSSSGSMIFSKTQHISRNYFGDEDPTCKDSEGFQILDFEIFPHAQKFSLKELKSEKLKPQHIEGVALKDGEAILVHGTNTIFTHEKVII